MYELAMELFEITGYYGKETINSRSSGNERDFVRRREVRSLLLSSK